jgi:hypothetical protein
MTVVAVVSHFFDAQTLGQYLTPSDATIDNIDDLPKLLGVQARTVN